MSQLVIVAIPSQEEFVWKLSSEKVPHVTLLNLGEHPGNFNTNTMADFLGHVANTSMQRFGLDVDRRGELGANKADVLFFNPKNSAVKMLEKIRSFLLSNSEISKAFNSTEQFPVWIPHLTMGFPESPAKPDKREFPGISWVNFDRVALWTSDFAGPEFLLKDNMVSGEVSMSDKIDDVLSHFGIKGMHWGVKKSSTPMHSPSTDHASATAAKAKAKKGGTKTLSNKELQDLITRMNLEQQYSRLVPPSGKSRLLKAGAKFAGDILIGVGKSQVTKLANDQATQLVGSFLKK